jgi:hypothetical protein
MGIRKKTTLTAAIIICALLATLSTSYFFKPSKGASLNFDVLCSGTVDKKPGESFTVKITFKNKGTTDGTWNTTVTFEGDYWIWKGEKKELVLESDEKETLMWEGNVPVDAEVDSIARLVVYHDGDYVALNWWIHVISGAELCVVDSKVS